MMAFLRLGGVSSVIHAGSAINSKELDVWIRRIGSSSSLDRWGCLLFHSVAVGVRMR